MQSLISSVKSEIGLAFVKRSSPNFSNAAMRLFQSEAVASASANNAPPPPFFIFVLG
ncbi:MAG: hypothetical protein LBO72_01270 [Helicobacteraceae bacterium]|jgi:hypothetical protein|nr:hypothetical protein [Helicobacteraceae bacterium]